MTTPIIITLCVLLLFAYIFEITASRTKIPAVILLLLLGWAVKTVLHNLNVEVYDLTPILPLLGTVGLILIVLDGSLELVLDKSKVTIIGKSALLTISTILIMSFGIAFAFSYLGNIPFRVALINAIPFAIISSAVAIPSAKHLISADKEFVTYESSLSDIIGVIFFNYILLNQNYGLQSMAGFVVEMMIVLFVTFIATLLLAFLLSKVKHHVKYVPIIIMIVLIYAIVKFYHLPGLIYIFIFGLFLGNLDKIKKLKFIKYLQPEVLSREVVRFKELTTEVTFLIRALFFLLFGFLLETKELLNQNTILWAIGIATGIFFVRFLMLKIFKLPVNPLLFLAPRGLITILLFLSIPLALNVEIVNKSLIIQVIILSAIVMMLGMMKLPSSKNKS